MLPGTTLNGGGWVAPSESSVDCSTDHLRCTEVSSPNATISLYIPTGQGIESTDDGWYKCCLPTSCSDPNTSIIFANIFSKYFLFYKAPGTGLFIAGWVQIEGVSADLPSDITVLPQTYTLHAVKIGHPNPSTNAANWYYESGDTSTELCTIGSNNRNFYNCIFGDGMSVDKGNGRRVFTLNITWNEENITSGIFSQSNNNGDLKYRFYLHVSNVMRNRTITITGRVLEQLILVYEILRII